MKGNGANPQFGKLFPRSSATLADDISCQLSAIVLGVGGERHRKPAALRLGGRRLPNPLAEHGCVVPSKTQLGIGGESSQGPQRFGPVIFIVEKDVPLFAFDERQYIDVLVGHVMTSCRCVPAGETQTLPCERRSRRGNDKVTNRGSIGFERAAKPSEFRVGKRGVAKQSGFFQMFQKVHPGSGRL